MKKFCGYFFLKLKTIFCIKAIISEVLEYEKKIFLELNVDIARQPARKYGNLNSHRSFENIRLAKTIKPFYIRKMKEARLRILAVTPRNSKHRL